MNMNMNQLNFQYQGPLSQNNITLNQQAQNMIPNLQTKQEYAPVQTTEAPQLVAKTEPEKNAGNEKIEEIASKKISKKSKKGMGRLRMKRGGRRGKLTRTGLDMQSFFKTKICPYLLAGHCTKAEKCSYAHSQAELRDPPNLKKTKVCQQFSLGKCQMGSKCSYAHGENELRYTPEFFKTALCKNFQKGTCKFDINCRYAHGDEELRNPTFLDDQTVSLSSKFMDHSNIAGANPPSNMHQGVNPMMSQQQQMMSFMFAQGNPSAKLEANQEEPKNILTVNSDLLESFNISSVSEIVGK